MTITRWSGLAFSVLGYVLTIWGAWLLYLNAPPDVGQHGNLSVPWELRQMLKGFDDEQEIANIDRRKTRTKQGFLLIVIGSALQLAGTVVSALA